MTQLYNFKEYELDIVARFMGHDVYMLHNYYHLPEHSIQVAKVSKLLLAMERGWQGCSLARH